MDKEADACAKFRAQIDELNFAADDIEAEETLYQLVDLLDDVDDPSSVFPAVFRFFERNDGAEIGNPGPLVHFLEQWYPRYVDPLAESVRRAPVPHTLWMVNRILNDSAIGEPMRASLMELLEQTKNSSAADEGIRKSAANFLRFQRRGA
jgi:hypothetical protein